MTVLNTADKIMLGGSTVDAVYAGSTKVWPQVFTPKSLPGLGLWLDSNAVMRANGAAVSTWPDSSGNGHDAVAIDTPPVYDTSTNSVRFGTAGGNATRMQVPGWGTALSGKTQYTLFMVLAQSSAVGFGTYPVFTCAPTATLWDFITEFDFDGGVFWGHGNGYYRELAAASSLDTLHLMTFHFTPTGSHFYIDGTEPPLGFLGPNGTIQTTVPNLGPDVLLGGYYNGGLGIVGPISEVIWYDHALTDAERTKVETYLHNKWFVHHGLVFDPDTDAYLVATGLDRTLYGQTLDTLVVGLKSVGLWSKMTAIYPMVGGTANLHRWNLKDPRDTDDAYRLTFTGGTHSTALGYRPNEQGAMIDGNYADTHLVPLNALADVNSTHLAFYSLAEVPPGDRCEMGCYNWNGPGSRFHVIACYAGNYFYYGMSEEDATNCPMPSSTGLFVTTRTASNLTTAYRNGAQVASSDYAPTNGLPNFSVWVGGIDSYRGRSDLPCGFASVGSGLSTRNVSDLYNVVQAFQADLNRQV